MVVKGTASGSGWSVALHDVCEHHVLFSVSYETSNKSVFDKGDWYLTKQTHTNIYMTHISVSNVYTMIYLKC